MVLPETLQCRDLCRDLRRDLRKGQEGDWGKGVEMLVGVWLLHRQAGQVEGR
jgi:hypothetical protein